jgi:acyl carrier protein
MGTLERTKKVIAECLGRDLEQVRAESRLVSDLGAESIDLLELVFLLEREFGIRVKTEELIPDEREERREVVDRLTVADVAAVMDEKLNEVRTSKPARRTRRRIRARNNES